MVDRRTSSWNFRDRHMFETLHELATHLARHRDGTTIVVWAHNSHVGNAAATAMSDRGEFNIGQLARRTLGTEAALIGFTTYAGTVSAAWDWGAPVERKVVFFSWSSALVAYFVPAKSRTTRDATSPRSSRPK
jgi:erythromycin esterase-like protein